MDWHGIKYARCLHTVKTMLVSLSYDCFRDIKNLPDELILQWMGNHKATEIKTLTDMADDKDDVAGVCVLFLLCFPNLIGIEFNTIPTLIGKDVEAGGGTGVWTEEAK